MKHKLYTILSIILFTILGSKFGASKDMVLSCPIEDYDKLELLIRLTTSSDKNDTKLFNKIMQRSDNKCALFEEDSSLFVCDVQDIEYGIKLTTLCTNTGDTMRTYSAYIVYED